MIQSNEYYHECINSETLEYNLSQQLQTIRSPTQFLSVFGSKQDQQEKAAEKFFRLLENEVKKVGNFTKSRVHEIRGDLVALTRRIDFYELNRVKSDVTQKLMVSELGKVEGEYKKLEKYIDLNYIVFCKILKKYDKYLPGIQCRQFYEQYLKNQQWVQQEYSDLPILLNQIQLRLKENEGNCLNEIQQDQIERGKLKFCFQQSQSENCNKNCVEQIFQNIYQKIGNQGYNVGDVFLVNTVYLDNNELDLYYSKLRMKQGPVSLKLRWYGQDIPKFVNLQLKIKHNDENLSNNDQNHEKKQLVLPAEQIVYFLEGKYTLEQVEQDLKFMNYSDEQILTSQKLFIEIQNLIENKQLRPFMRIQFQRTKFQSIQDKNLLINIDQNIFGQKINIQQLGCLVGSQRDMFDAQIARTNSGKFFNKFNQNCNQNNNNNFNNKIQKNIFNFEFGIINVEFCASIVIEIKHLFEDENLVEVNQFNKFLLGVSLLIPEKNQVQPQWVKKFRNLELNSNIVDESIENSGQENQSQICFDPENFDASNKQIQEELLENKFQTFIIENQNQKTLQNHCDNCNSFSDLIQKTDLSNLPHNENLGEDSSEKKASSNNFDLNFQYHNQSQKQLINNQIMYQDFEEQVSENSNSNKQKLHDNENVEENFEQAVSSTNQSRQNHNKNSLQNNNHDIQSQISEELSNNNYAQNQQIFDENDVEEPLIDGEPNINILNQKEYLLRISYTQYSKPKNKNKNKQKQNYKKNLQSEGEAGLGVGRYGCIMCIEPKLFFANERTLLFWLQMAVTFASISAALLGFAAQTSSAKKLYSATGINLVETICLILFPISVVITFYGLYTYIWRGKRICRKQVCIIHDQFGPVFLMLTVVIALFSILVVSFVDMIATIQAQKQVQ